MTEKFSDEWHEKLKDRNSPEWREYCDEVDNFDFTIGNQEEYKHKDQQHRKTA